MHFDARVEVWHQAAACDDHLFQGGIAHDFTNAQRILAMAGVPKKPRHGVFKGNLLGGHQLQQQRVREGKGKKRERGGLVR